MSSRIRTENRRASLAQRLALAPYSVWAVIFVAVPLVFVAYYAFTDESFRFTTENLTKFFTAVSTITDDSGATREVHTYLLIFWRSVKLAVISTAILPSTETTIHSAASAAPARVSSFASAP